MGTEYLKLESLRLKINLIGLLGVVAVSTFLAWRMAAISEAFIVLNGAMMYFAGSSKADKQRDKKDEEHDEKITRLETRIETIEGGDDVRV